MFLVFLLSSILTAKAIITVHTLILRSCIKEAGSRLLAWGCWPGSVMFVETGSSMNSGGHMLCPVHPYVLSVAAFSQQTASLQDIKSVSGMPISNSGQSPCWNQSPGGRG